MDSGEKERKITQLQTAQEIPQIIDYKATMLIAAGAAMAANCEPCLNKVVPDLIEAGVAEADIRKAVEIGQFVKDKPAAIMKEAADALTGTHMSDPHKSDGCPAEALVPFKNSVIERHMPAADKIVTNPSKSWPPVKYFQP